jgi:hypothetical protein
MKSWVIVLISAVAAVSAVAQGESTSPANVAVASKGKMLVAANGARLGSVYRVSADGSAQLIIDGKMVTIPAATLSTTDGKLTTSLSKNEVSQLP